MLLALYGTLMRGCGAVERIGAAGGLRYEQACRIPGKLWDLGEYPGLTPGEGEVAGELHTVLDSAVLHSLDAFEEQGSLYVRRRLRLIEPPVEAWVYVYRRPLADAEPIPSGCWRTHLLKRGESQPS